MKIIEKSDDIEKKKANKCELLRELKENETFGSEDCMGLK